MKKKILAFTISLMAVSSFSNAITPCETWASATLQTIEDARDECFSTEEYSNRWHELVKWCNS